MQITVRIMTRPETYEERKRQLLDAGYEIDKEAPLPVNGLCSFSATKKPDSENLGQAV
jgi:hypothetical protein